MILEKFCDFFGVLFFICKLRIIIFILVIFKDYDKYNIKLCIERFRDWFMVIKFIYGNVRFNFLG